MTEPGRDATLRYPAASDVVADAGGARLALALDQGRGAVGVHGRVRDPALLRDGLMTAAAVLASDLRYKGRDRATYLAYLAKQGKKASKEIWEAHKQFLDQAFADEVAPRHTIDPFLTVDPDAVALEVFSRDQSAYARLALAAGLLDGRAAAHGTACVDFSAAVVDKLDRMRAWAGVELDASTTTTGATATPVSRDVEIPAPWLRSFLQVQSAATLPMASCALAPIDLYNLLFVLRTRKAKTSPRALRFELIPGLPPRLIVEPWEIVLEGHAGPYRGPAPRVVRTFGRQRLLALARALPHVRGVRAHLAGPGLPTFWVLDLGLATLTLGLTGWTESAWASAAAFDVLTPPASAHALADAVVARLDAAGPQDLGSLAAATSAPVADVRAALQLGSLRGLVLFDIATGQYRPRRLLATPVADEVVRFGSDRERAAHRLLDGGGTITLTKIHTVSNRNVKYCGEALDLDARRTFKPGFTADAEGRVTGAECGCPTFLRSGLREGPCEHMIALRLTVARKRAADEALRQTPEGRQLIRAETRTWVRRDRGGRDAEQVHRLTLDGRVVAVEWGARGAEPRRQRAWYDSDADARDAYFARQDELAAGGFVDADAEVA